MSPRKPASPSAPAEQAFTPAERAAMRERAAESRAAHTSKLEGESVVRAKIAAMPEPERTMALRLHDLIMTTAPDLVPRLWYGMPAYAQAGKVVCFFQSAQKFKTRYATLGFTDAAHLDEGAMWPTAFALLALTPAEEERIVALVRKAVSLSA